MKPFYVKHYARVNGKDKLVLIICYRDKTMQEVLWSKEIK